MKSKLITLGVIGVMLIGTSACGTKHQAQNNQGGQTQASGQANNNSQSKSGNSGSTNNSAKNNQSSSGSSKKSSGSSNNQSSNGSNTSSTSSSSGSGTSNSTSSNTSSAPKSQKEAFNQIAAALHTKVPLMLPTEVPISGETYLTATTTSQKWYYKTQLFQTNKPARVNSQAASDGTPVASVEGTEYSSSTKAHDSINGYVKADLSQGNTIDLGHNIKAEQSGATGHDYLMWNEGRWSIKVDAPNDPNYKAKNYEDNKKVAEDIVAYLHDHALPAPQDIGIINVSLWNNSLETTVHWQDHEMTYQVSSNDPLTAVKTATAMKFR